MQMVTWPLSRERHGSVRFFRRLKSDPGVKARHEERKSIDETPLQVSHAMRSTTVGDGGNAPSDSERKDLKRALSRVSGLRDRLYGKRLQLKEKRNELRQERSVLGENDAKFMKSVRQFRERSRDRDNFDDRYYTDLELQRDVVGSLQYEYDQDEDEHDLGENELEMEEANLDRLLSRLLDQGSDDGDETSSCSSAVDHVPPEELGYLAESEAQVRMNEYQSRVGDARIMQERLADIIAEQGVRREFAMLKENVGWERADGDEEEDFDQDFKERYFEIASELEIIKADLKRLETGLIDAGHWAPETPAPTQPVEQLPSRSHSGKPQASSPLARTRRKSDSLVPLLQTELSIARVRRARLSRWILVTFGSSPIEQSRHKEMVRHLGRGVWGGESLDDLKWARLVFEHWKTDEPDASSWDEVVAHDLLDYYPAEKPAARPADSILLPGILKAENAVNGFEQQFCTDRDRYDHSTPYSPLALELDIHSEYESRSI